MFATGCPDRQALIDLSAGHGPYSQLIDAGKGDGRAAGRRDANESAFATFAWIASAMSWGALRPRSVWTAAVACCSTTVIWTLWASAIRHTWQHDPFGAEIVGGVMYGRGTSDMKGALAAMVYGAKIARSTARSPCAASWYVVGVVQEEPCEGLGIRVLIEEEGLLSRMRSSSARRRTCRSAVGSVAEWRST